MGSGLQHHQLENMYKENTFKLSFPQLAMSRRAAPRFASAAFVDGATPDIWGRIPKLAEKDTAEEEVLPAKGPARSPAGLSEVS